MRPVRPGDGVNSSRRLSTNFRPSSVVKAPEPYTRVVGEKVRGIPPTTPGGSTSTFKLGTGVKLGEKKLGE